MDRLNNEDRILWATITRTVTPLKGRKSKEEPRPEAILPPEEPLDASRSQALAITPLPSSEKKGSPRPAQLDLPTKKKLAKGSIRIDGRIDLHGLTQGEAHILLFAFLHRAYMEDRRYVLVITGKGSSFGSDGILRRAVPAWMATPSFRSIVGAHEPAARHHGGAGALYVRLKRRERAD
jgi:DNA-nicking Smr family endonuclease